MQHLEGNLGAATSPLEARHRASRLNSRFHGGSGDFAKYIDEMRDMIARVRSGEDAIRLQKTIAGNAPFELAPPPGFARGRHKLYRRGVLLIHGLTDSPYSMRHLGEIFRQNGFRVLALLLPGHGTRPGDLLDVTWQEWAKAVAYATEQLALEADEIYLAGYSAGAALAIHHSLSDTRVRGLFLFSPALDITHRAAWAWVHKVYSWLAPGARWVGIKPDRDPYKYESFPKNAAAQLFALCQAVRHQLHGRALNLPVFTAVSLDDSSVIASATLQFMAAAPHPLNHLVLYTTDPATPVPGIAQAQLELIDSRAPAQRILGSAHTALVQPPEDEHYGARGEYCNCLHYYPDDMAQYQACWQHTGEVWLGEVTARNLAAGTLRRLTYNPHFAELRASLQHFIERLP
ncbi:MAG TPA: alpha/beta fold hydrolase [Gallionellaceae bacterium]|nr:alpha/beta fold hydrolase [Gallionellaceae bacterium]